MENKTDEFRLQNYRAMENRLLSANSDVRRLEEELASLKEENAKLKDVIKAFLEPSEKFLGAYCISSFYINQLKEVIERAKTLIG